MTTYLHRCMIVPADIAPNCRALTAGLAGDAGSNMFVVPLSASGELPATHYISSGMQDEAFCALMPLTSFDAEGLATTTPGQPDTVAYLATQAGMTTTSEQVKTLFAVVDVTVQDWQTALIRKGLQMIKGNLV